MCVCVCVCVSVCVWEGGWVVGVLVYRWGLNPDGWCVCVYG